ncbi:uncharacterized protein LOC144866423 [Branchiostoma floridae x Branchiostoma japonicum]
MDGPQDMLLGLGALRRGTSIKFLLSQKCFFARRSLDDSKDKLRLALKEGGFDPDPEDPEHITTTADPRVFLMKQTRRGGAPDLVFDWHTSPGHVITLSKNPRKPAELQSEESGGDDQLFGLHWPIKRVRSGHAAAEPEELEFEVPKRVQFPFKPLDEQFEKCEDQEAQLHD